MTPVAGLDSADELAGYRSRFFVGDDEVVYMDGNSLGRMPLAAIDILQQAAVTEWGDGLVRSWHDWIHLPGRIGDRIARIIGAGHDEVVMSDQTSVNLYKLATAAVGPDRPDIVTDTTNFPSDIYVLRGVAESAGGRLRVVDTDDLVGPTADRLAPHLDGRVGLVSVSHVAFKSGAITDLESVAALARERGAMSLFDLSHSVGAIPIEIGDTGADLAVGCTYKHCNGGPGAPAFLYVRRDLQDRLVQPIRGWWGHDAMFDFDTRYTPASGIRRFLTGTPPVIAMRVAEPGIDMVGEAGIDAIRTKGLLLGGLLEEGYDRTLAGLGYELGSPRGAATRGHHLSLRHPEGYRITQALIARKVIPDFRAPDNIRIGISPLYQRPSDIAAAVDALADIVLTGSHLDFDPAPAIVT